MQLKDAKSFAYWDSITAGVATEVDWVAAKKVEADRPVGVRVKT